MTKEKDDEIRMEWMSSFKIFILFSIFFFFANTFLCLLYQRILYVSLIIKRQFHMVVLIIIYYDLHYNEILSPLFGRPSLIKAAHPNIISWFLSCSFFLFVVFFVIIIGLVYICSFAFDGIEKLFTPVFFFNLLFLS